MRLKGDTRVLQFRILGVEWHADPKELKLFYAQEKKLAKSTANTTILVVSEEILFGN